MGARSVAAGLPQTVVQQLGRTDPTESKIPGVALHDEAATPGSVNRFSGWAASSKDLPAVRKLPWTRSRPLCETYRVLDSLRLFLSQKCNEGPPGSRIRRSQLDRQAISAIS